jgi:hypothetical protein
MPALSDTFPSYPFLPFLANPIRAAPSRSGHAMPAQSGHVANIIYFALIFLATDFAVILERFDFLFRSRIRMTLAASNTCASSDSTAYFCWKNSNSRRAIANIAAR